MIKRKPMTDTLKTKIYNYIKNRIDISDIIDGYDIKGLNLNRAIISRFDRPDDDLRDTVFSNAIIGEPGRITNLSRTKLCGSSFKNARLQGVIWFRHADLRRCNFTGCHMPHLDFRFADFRNCNFCNVCFPFGSIANKVGIHAKFSDDLFDGIVMGWELPLLKPSQVRELLKNEQIRPLVLKMLKENNSDFKE